MMAFGKSLATSLISPIGLGVTAVAALVAGIVALVSAHKRQKKAAEEAAKAEREYRLEMEKTLKTVEQRTASLAQQLIMAEAASPEEKLVAAATVEVDKLTRQWNASYDEYLEIRNQLDKWKRISRGDLPPGKIKPGKIKEDWAWFKKTDPSDFRRQIRELEREQGLLDALIVAAKNKLNADLASLDAQRHKDEIEAEKEAAEKAMAARRAVFERWQQTPMGKIVMAAKQMVAEHREQAQMRAILKTIEAIPLIGPSIADAIAQKLGIADTAVSAAGRAGPTGAGVSLTAFASTGRGAGGPVFGSREESREQKKVQDISKIQVALQWLIDRLQANPNILTDKGSPL